MTTLERIVDRIALIVWGLTLTLVLLWTVLHPIVAGILQMALVLFALAWRYRWHHHEAEAA